MINKNERIQKVLSNYGSLSRRETEKLIREKKITINGKIAQLGDKVYYDDEIKVNNKIIQLNFNNQYFLLNKPKGYICSRVDERNKPAISLIKNSKNLNLFTIGRLDVMSTGLIIVTNDGALSNYVLSPKSHVSKTYLVTIPVRLNDQQMQKLRDGIKLESGYQSKRPRELLFIKDLEKKLFIYKITLIEGKNNQIRKMFEVLNITVIDLKRISIGKLKLGNLKLKEYIEMDKNTIYYQLGFNQENE